MCGLCHQRESNVNVSVDEKVNGYVRVTVVLGIFLGMEALGDHVWSCGTTVVTVIEDV